ncbi:hypothetical protein DL764_005935 [Monosporascus ibericus]|uniref:ARB-07466-like C-terminal domain-containing protein n=1 Tax=Monosporascus ibericus TaxID=155417 RepID=A0A4Q4T9X3_9PEZI|nr:hypothetical protein DL764_005935 [Monosporascus ibericus]
MQLQSIIVSVALVVGPTFAAVNEPCIGRNGAAGVCVSTSACSSAGGTSITGACPWDPVDIRCCTKPSCSNGSNGNCRWTSDCAGSTVVNQCPGPAAFRCCSSTARGFGGYDAPGIPGVGACRASAVAGARAVVAAFPGRVREIGCFRQNCACSTSDHCCGNAIDFMCSDAAGAPTMSGREIAEWVMNRASAQNVKYIIWGQKIWNPSRDGVSPWTSWRTMEDRNSITQNHWDHVHVSYNS